MFQENNDEVTWLQKVEQLQQNIEKVFNTKRLTSKLMGPATENEVKLVEDKLGYQIPHELKEFFLKESKYAFMNWMIPEGFHMPSEIDDIDGGGIEMGLSIVFQMNQSHQELVDTYYKDSTNSYDVTLHNKFVFHTTWSGDFYAVDLNEANYGRVLYLSYEDSPWHNYILGQTFTDFINRWTSLAFVGPGGSDLEYFLDNKSDGLNSYGKNASLLKEIIYK